MEPQKKKTEFPSRNPMLAKHTKPHGTTKKKNRVPFTQPYAGKTHKTAWNHKKKKQSSLHATLCWQNTQNRMEPQKKKTEFPSRSPMLAKHTKPHGTPKKK